MAKLLDNDVAVLQRHIRLSARVARDNDGKELEQPKVVAKVLECLFCMQGARD